MPVSCGSAFGVATAMPYTRLEIEISFISITNDTPAVMKKSIIGISFIRDAFHVIGNFVITTA